jgi:molybdate/tungstate transport system substrate-binding protein
LIKNRRFYTVIKKGSPVLKIIPLLLSLLLVAIALTACPQPATETTPPPTTSVPSPSATTTPPAPVLSGQLQIFNAGSLTAPFEQVSEAFNKIHPDVQILAEAAGSATTIRKVTELGTECGVIGSADYQLIPQLMFPQYADWYIIFASNEMCIAYTDQSQFADEINGDNWYQILQREGVTFGRSDPDQDPCGYRTLMVWQLAEKYYNVSGLYDSLYEAAGDTMRPKETDLLALLQSGDLDYAFEYSSIALQQNLKYVAFPPEINLSDVDFEDFYAQAEVEIAGAQPGEKITMKGSPIVYAVTIPTNFPRQELAIAWVDFLLSDQGMAIMEANFQTPIIPAKTNDASLLPDTLKKYVE